MRGRASITPLFSGVRCAKSFVTKSPTGAPRIRSGSATPVSNCFRISIATTRTEYFTFNKDPDLNHHLAPSWPRTTTSQGHCDATRLLLEPMGEVSGGMEDVMMRTCSQQAGCCGSSCYWPEDETPAQQLASGSWAPPISLDALLRALCNGVEAAEPCPLRQAAPLDGGEFQLLWCVCNGWFPQPCPPHRALACTAPPLPAPAPCRARRSAACV